MKDQLRQLFTLCNPSHWSKIVFAWVAVLALTAMAVSATQAASGFAPKANAT